MKYDVGVVFPLLDRTVDFSTLRIVPLGFAVEVAVSEGLSEARYASTITRKRGEDGTYSLVIPQQRGLCNDGFHYGIGVA